jgi:predicted transporter
MTTGAGGSSGGGGKPVIQPTPTVVLERTFAWYVGSVVAGLVPLALVGGVDTIWGNSAWNWDDLLGKGELLLIAVPVSGMALATMYAAPKLKRSSATLGVLWGLVLVNGLSLVILVVNSLAKLLNKGSTPELFFLIASGLLFLTAALLGGTAVQLAKAGELGE